MINKSETKPIECVHCLEVIRIPSMTDPESRVECPVCHEIFKAKLALNSQAPVAQVLDSTTGSDPSSLEVEVENVKASANAQPHNVGGSPTAAVRRRPATGRLATGRLATGRLATGRLATGRLGHRNASENSAEKNSLLTPIDLKDSVNHLVAAFDNKSDATSVADPTPVVKAQVEQTVKVAAVPNPDTVSDSAQQESKSEDPVNATSNDSSSEETGSRDSSSHRSRSSRPRSRRSKSISNEFEADGGWNNIGVDGLPINRRSERLKPVEEESQTGVKELALILVGGLISLPMTQLCLWWFVGIDPLGLAPRVFEVVPQVVPMKMQENLDPATVTLT